MNRAPTKWSETTTQRPCPACGHAGYCTLSADGEFCLCRRGVVSDRPKQQKDGVTAYLHAVAKLGKPVVKGTPKASTPKLSAAEIKGMLKQQQTALSPKRLELEAKRLGVSQQAIEEYRGGWDARTGLLSIPMFDGEEKCIGFSLRTHEGPKKCIPGSSNGLFIPASFKHNRYPDDFMNPAAPMLLVAPEGPSDCMAMFDVGFTAIGFPNAQGGAQFLARLLARCKEAGKARDVVIIGDNDKLKRLADGTPYWPGWEGALAKAAAIGIACKSLKVFKFREAKDARQMLRDKGAAVLSAMIMQLIDSTPAATPEWIRAKREEVDLWRGRLKKKAGAA